MTALAMTPDQLTAQIACLVDAALSEPNTVATIRLLEQVLLLCGVPIQTRSDLGQLIRLVAASAAARGYMAGLERAKAIHAELELGRAFRAGGWFA